MIENQEDDEFIAVRVQDPRVQNEGSWNPHVDYKIFLHTNSKSFTAKTSCVRRRYSEFVWLKKRLQKNSGLVPVPSLPGKSLFSFVNEDFLERRRTGLQTFLDKVVHMTVCLSDSQLHLFMQTQLPVRHIEDCVQGHTPYTVMDAILTYASSNQGYAQAQQEDLLKERGSSVVSYESMESPAPHLPSQTGGGERDPLLAIAEGPDNPTATATGQLIVCRSDDLSLQVLQVENRLEAVIEQHGAGPTGPAPTGPAPTGPAPTFYLESGRDSDPPRAGRIQTAVEVHSPTAGDAAAAPDWQVVEEDEEEVVVVEEVLENGCVLAEECVAVTESKEEADLRAPSVSADGALTDHQEEREEKEQEEEEQEQEEGMKGDSGDRAEAVCCTTELPDHAVSEREEDEKVEEEEELEEVNSEQQQQQQQQQQVLNQTSSVAAQQPDLKRRSSCEEPAVEPVGASREQPSERTNHPQEDEGPGAGELRCADDEAETSVDAAPNGLPNRASESDATDEEDVPQGEGSETSSTEPRDEVVIILSASQQEDGIQNANGHSGKSSDEVAPSTGAEDARAKSNAYDLILSAEDGGGGGGGGQQRGAKAAAELSPSTRDLGDLGV